jgi:two-component system phosphate regulon response regulator OmpR
VDDDDRIRELLKALPLAHAGARVSAAADAAGARKLARGAMDFDLLILDVMMPVEDGFSLAESVRKNLQSADCAADGARHGRRSHPRPLHRR